MFLFCPQVVECRRNLGYTVFTKVICASLANWQQLAPASEEDGTKNLDLHSQQGVSIIVRNEPIDYGQWCQLQDEIA